MQKMEGNIKELSTYPAFNVQLNLETLLTLQVENQHAGNTSDDGQVRKESIVH